MRWRILLALTMCLVTHMRLGAYTYAYMYTFYVYIYKKKKGKKQMYIYIYMYTYICIYIYIDTFSHTYSFIGTIQVDKTLRLQTAWERCAVLPILHEFIGTAGGSSGTRSPAR